MINEPSQTPYASPSAVGVKPDARLSAAFLTQAFAWMFAGLLLTAACRGRRHRQRQRQGVRRRLSAVHHHRPARPRGRHLGRDQQDLRDGRTRAVLHLRRVGRPQRRPDRGRLHPGFGRPGVPERGGDVRGCRDLRRRHQALAREHGRLPDDGHHRAPCRDAPEYLPEERRAQPAHLDRRHRHLHGPHGLRRPAHPVRATSRLASGRWRRRRSSGRSGCT